MNPDDLPPLREIVERHNLKADKALGQNFLFDQNITDKIAAQAGDLSNASVFEIGPGPGGLTRSLLRAGAAEIIAIEYDERAVRALAELAAIARNRLAVHHADALEVDLLTIGARMEQKKIVANLPYNIASALLVKWLKLIRDRGDISGMTLMFQKEVAQRITARPGTKAYGRLSVLSQWLCDARILFDIAPEAFTPRPKVTSSVVMFRPKDLQGNAPAFEALENLTRAAFGQRRKMIRSSLKSYRTVWEAIGKSGAERAEDITPAEYVAMAALI